jgi:hypothetical protein
VNRLEVSGQVSGRIPDSSASKKLSGFFIWNLAKLMNLAPGVWEGVGNTATEQGVRESGNMNPKN